MRRIEPLPERVRSTVRSGIILYDLARVVEELVFNSLDAGATKVSVAVGVATSFVKVSDNGSGIDREGLLLLGERYVTSKRNQLADLSSNSGFGFRGEALCSISDVSVLEIVSKVQGMPHGYRKVMKGCKCLYLGISDDRHDAGTTVIVRDLFYNQPVRRKHMQSSPKKVLHLTRECVLRIALVHSRVSFKVIDAESQDELLGTSSSSCSLSLLSSNFGIQGASSLYELNASKGELRLSGYLSGPSGVLSLKALQYIYINSRFVCKGPIHKLLNQLAAVYLDDKAHNAHGQIEKPCSRSLACPSFILNLSCPRSHYDVTFEPLKNSVEFEDWCPVLRFIQDTVSHFWSENVSDDLPEYREIKRKKSRTHQEQAPVQVPILPSEKLVEDGNSLPPLKASSSSYPMSSEDASDVKKPLDDPFLVEGAYRGLGLNDMSPFSCEVTTNQMSHNADFASSKPYSNEDNYVLKELSMKDSRCKQVDFSLESEWRNASLEMKDQSTFPIRTTRCANFHEFVNADQVFAKPSLLSHSKGMRLQDLGSSFRGHAGMEFVNADFNKQTMWFDIGEEVDVGDQVVMDQIAIPIRNTLFPSFHEYADVANANQVSAKPSQSSHLKEKLLQDIGLPCTGEGVMEFSNVDFSLQTKCVDLGVEVDAGDQVDMGLIIEQSQPRHDVAKPLWWLSRCSNQHDKILKSKPLSHDMRTNLTAGEWSDEENYHESHSHKRSKILDSMSLSSISEWSQRMPNYLSDQILDTDKFIGGDVHFEAGISSGYGCFRDDNEDKYHKSDCDDWLGAECTDFSDCKYYASLQEDIGEVGGYNLANPCLSKCSDLFSDEVNQVCMNADKSKVQNTSNASCHKSVSTQLDRNKIGMIKIRNKESQYQKTEARRSNSAPPVYKGRRKFLDLHSLKIEAQQSDSVDTNSPETGNIRHESRAFDERHFFSKEIYVNDSLCVPRLENEGFQQNGQCINSSFPNQHEDTMSKENQDNSKFDLKWRKDCQLSIGGGGIKDLSVIQGVMKSRNAGDHDTILDVLSGTLHFAGDSLVPTSISKTCLRDAKVLQQVDKKFIPVVAGNILAIIDQHAADERIRLEELRQKVLSGEMKQITYLEAEKELVVPEIGYQLLHSYVEQIRDWGWICDIHGPGSRSFAKKMNVLHKQQTVAKLVAVPCILGVNLTDTDLLEFLQQLADTDGSSTIPPSVLRILNNKACRGAIMFGDTLLPSECSLIVEELKKTSLCFQCAHGRPTTVPLVNLDVLHKQIDKLALRGKGSQQLWHGLRRQEISLERAASRLSTAMI